MTQYVTSQGVPSEAAHARHPPSTGRLIGVDLARGLAVFGMYAAHVGPDPSEGGVIGFVMELAHGRSSALFAFLAGFSLVLLTGRREPKIGVEGRQAVLRVVVRAAILLLLGTALTMAGTSVEVILAYYGLFFVLVLPLYRLRPATLAILAAGTALVLPQVWYASLGPIESDAWHETVIAHDPLARLSGTDGFTDLFFTGSYPALVWLPFVIAGMAVARLDLASRLVRVRLGLVGAGLALAGHGGSWLALHLVPGLPRTLSETAFDSSAVMESWWSDRAGLPDSPSAAWMWVAAPHSGTTFSLLANTGVALCVLVVCLTVIGRWVRVRRVLTPVIAVGTMSLTAYVFHIGLIAVLDHHEEPLGPPLLVLLGFIAAAMLPAVLWSRFFRRGPLEYLLYRATTAAAERTKVTAGVAAVFVVMAVVGGALVGAPGAA
ncbi:DUF418 domain-containing protein [Streptomyces sp. NPDC003077]|uniref:DUF418 domain-containing protein n=1 Tax=Streptomyces sp. NPDC003077 TaxID=3154443 RepID=UPI0033BDC2FD